MEEVNSLKLGKAFEKIDEAMTLIHEVIIVHWDDLLIRDRLNRLSVDLWHAGNSLEQIK